jgi:hypothetical protein
MKREQSKDNVAGQIFEDKIINSKDILKNKKLKEALGIGTNPAKADAKRTHNPEWEKKLKEIMGKIKLTTKDKGGTD